MQKDSNPKNKILDRIKIRKKCNSKNVYRK